MNMEIFKNVVKFEDTYEVSNLGRVRNKKTGKFKEFAYNKKGYKYVNLYYSHRGFIKWYIHRLVAMHFIDNPENLPQVNHKDGNKQNNNVENLEWCTNKENTNHAVKNFLRSQGENCHFHKFSIKQIFFIERLINLGFSVHQIGLLTKTKSESIWCIVNRKYWKSLNLNFSNIRKGIQPKDFVIKITQEDYDNIINYWGNTVLSTLIAKGKVLVLSIEGE